MWMPCARKRELPTRGPRRCRAAPSRCRCRNRHFVNGHIAETAVPGRARDGDFRHGLLLGRRALFWQTAGRLHHGGRLCRRLHAQPDLRGGVLRHDRPYRGGAGRVRSQAASATTALLKIFWESHDPTQGMRQGNDVGTQYRSAIYATTPAQQSAAEASRRRLSARRWPPPASAPSPPRSREAPPFYYAEDYHQQYLGKNPDGYCGLGGTGVTCPTPARGGVEDHFPAKTGLRFSMKARRPSM